MDASSVETTIRSFLEEHVLQQQGTGLQNDTPLLSTGVLNSLSLVRLVAFLQDEFGIDVPLAEVTGHRFTTVSAIAGLVAELRDETSPATTAAGR